MALHIACQAGHLEIVKLLLQENVVLSYENQVKKKKKKKKNEEGKEGEEHHNTYFFFFTVWVNSLLPRLFLWTSRSCCTSLKGTSRMYK